MTVLQTLKNGRAAALKEFETTRKEYAKNEQKANAFAKILATSKLVFDNAAQELKALDAAIGGMSGGIETSKTPAKKGRAAKAAPAVTTRKYTKRAVQKESAPKSTTKTKSTTAAKSRQSAGRNEVREGKRPSLKEAMFRVMGNKVMTKVQVFEALKAKDWLPASNKPLVYVGFILSSAKTKDKSRYLFERAEEGRGHYRARPEESTETTETQSLEKTPKGKAKPKKTAARAKKEAAVETNGSSHRSADALLLEAGVLDTQSPIGA